MKLKEFDYFGFNHKAVKDKFEGDLEFICEMPIPIMTGAGPTPMPCAVYKNHNPNVKKGHKDYMLLFSQGDTYFVTGRSEAEMDRLWKISAVTCNNCNTVLISIDRHHFNKCDCQNETFVDGGMHYQRVGGKDMSLIGDAIVDMKTKQIKVLT